jgi:hypothetical protein
MTCACGAAGCNWCEGEPALGRGARTRRDDEVWAVVESVEWECSSVRSLHRTKAGAWRAAHALRYRCAEDSRTQPWLAAHSFHIERREVLP